MLPDCVIDKEPDSGALIALSIAEFYLLLERAAEPGARRTLHKVGLDGQDAAEDIHDLRSLLAGLPLAPRTAGHTTVQLITTSILLDLIAGLDIKLIWAVAFVVGCFPRGSCVRGGPELRPIGILIPTLNRPELACGLAVKLDPARLTNGHRPSLHGLWRTSSAAQLRYTSKLFHAEETDQETNPLDPFINL